MIKKAAFLGLLAVVLAGAVSAQEGKVSKGISRLDHVFVIMMENHGYKQIVGNPGTPFGELYGNSANSAAHYFALARRAATTAKITPMPSSPLTPPSIPSARPLPINSSKRASPGRPTRRACRLPAPMA